MASGQVALWGGGLLAAGLVAGWMIRRRDRGVAQLSAAGLVLLGGMVLLSLLRGAGLFLWWV
jgi:hypothetical protein